VLEQLAAAPEKLHERVPTGAGFPAVPVTNAVKVIGLPTLSDNGEAVPVTEIVGVDVPRLMEIAPEVIVK